MVRPIEFEEKKVLGSAMRCFWKQGYAATSMRDLEKATGLSTGSIYNSFGNKDGLFERSLDFYVDTVIQRRIDTFLGQADARQGILDFFADSMDKPEQIRAMGCLLVNTGIEGEHHSGRVHQKMKAAQKKVNRALLQSLTRGLQGGQITTKTEPVSLARHLGMLLSGLLVRLRSDKTTGWHGDTLKFVSNLMD